jgi:type 1 glutamine amidotransferase
LEIGGGKVRTIGMKKKGLSGWVSASAMAAMLLSGLGMSARAVPLFKVVGFYSDTVEGDHAAYAHAAIQFYKKLAVQKNFQFDSTKDWKNNCTYAFMSQYNVVLWLDLFCYTTAQQADFQKYIENGGAWMGFHASGYYDNSMTWPWENQVFIEQGNYCANNWPPASFKLITDDQTHPATLRLPKKWNGPINEYYQFCPSPRTKSDLKILVSIDPTALTFGTGTDCPIIWTNTKFSRMIYSNIGHGALAIGTDSNYTNLLTDAIMWLGTPATGIGSSGFSMRHSGPPQTMTARSQGKIVSLSVPGAGRICATLINEKGLTVSTGKGNNGLCRVNGAGTAAGMYILRINSQKGTFTQRLFLE